MSGVLASLAVGIALALIAWRLSRLFGLRGFRRALAQRVDPLRLTREAFGPVKIRGELEGRAVEALLSRARRQATVRVALARPIADARDRVQASSTPASLRRAIRDDQVRVWSDALSGVIMGVEPSAGGAIAIVRGWERLLQLADQIEALPPLGG